MDVCLNNSMSQLTYLHQLSVFVAANNKLILGENERLRKEIKRLEKKNKKLSQRIVKSAPINKDVFL